MQTHKIHYYAVIIAHDFLIMQLEIDDGSCSLDWDGGLNEGIRRREEGNGVVETRVAGCLVGCEVNVVGMKFRPSDSVYFDLSSHNNNWISFFGAGRKI